MSEGWLTQEEFERDLVLYSDFPTELTKDTGNVKRVEVPKSIQKYHQRIEETAKRNQPEVDETLTYIIPGRGRGIRSRLVEPGKLVEYNTKDDEVIKKKLREVSGMGYSNEMIEESFRAKWSQNGTSSTSTQPELEFENIGKRKQFNRNKCKRDSSLSKDEDS